MRGECNGQCADKATTCYSDGGLAKQILELNHDWRIGTNPNTEVTGKGRCTF